MGAIASDVDNRFVIFSRLMAQNMSVPGRYAVISINDNWEDPQRTREELCRVRRGYLDMLQVVFDDITPESHDPFAFPYHLVMSDAIAEEIVRFWDRWRNDVDRFMVHCAAGISRSAAVGSALARLEGNREAEEVCYMGTAPNVHVRSMIDRAAAKLRLGPYA